jgi:hypothetical protein
MQQDPEEWHYCFLDEVFARAEQEGDSLNLGISYARKRRLGNNDARMNMFLPVVFSQCRRSWLCPVCTIILGTQHARAMHSSAELADDSASTALPHRCSCSCIMA